MQKDRLTDCHSFFLKKVAKSKIPITNNGRYLKFNLTVSKDQFTFEERKINESQGRNENEKPK